MNSIIAHELIDPSSEKRYLGNRGICRFCGSTDKNSFGKKTNAHTFPKALGNKTLFSIDECMECNQRFSRYEDALCKAIGPFLTLGGVRGKSGVRQTGSSSANYIQHKNTNENKKLKVKTHETNENLVAVSKDGSILKFHIPIPPERYVPLFAYKSLLKIAISLLPGKDLHHYKKSIACLNTVDKHPETGSLNVGFSYAFIGNAPPTLAGALLKRSNATPNLPYYLAIFQAGSVCFQIALNSDEKDQHVPEEGKLEIIWKSELAKPEGGYFSIEYCKPIQFDWSSKDPQHQPFEAFDLTYDIEHSAGVFIPVPRNT